MNSRAALLALAVGAFAIGTTEFTPMGLLPVIASGVGVSIPTAGMLITAYAVGVMLGAPVMTLLMGRFGKRTALMLLMSIFVIGNLLSALAPNYGLLLLSRLVTSLNHGAFFGIGAVVAASLVPKEKQAAAVATMFMGLTIANIGGVPLATWVGQQLGWRLAFAGTAVLGVVAISALAMALPPSAAGARPDVRRELKSIMQPQVLLAMATTVLGAGAMFTLYTYVAPVLTELTGASNAFIALSLALIGIGFTFGNGIGGRRHPDPAGGTCGADVRAAAGFHEPRDCGAGCTAVRCGDLRDRAAVADPGDAGGQRGAGPGVVDQRRCFQPRQCTGRGAGWCGDQPGAGVRGDSGGRWPAGSVGAAAGVAGAGTRAGG